MIYLQCVLRVNVASRRRLRVVVAGVAVDDHAACAPAGILVTIERRPPGANDPVCVVYVRNPETMQAPLDDLLDFSPLISR